MTRKPKEKCEKCMNKIQFLRIGKEATNLKSDNKEIIKQCETYNYLNEMNNEDPEYNGAQKKIKRI